MIVTKDFVFVHVPRTGGMWFGEVLRKNKLIIGQGNIHQMFCPERYSHLPRVAIKRDPYDWYPSWFEVMRNHISLDWYLSALSNEREDLNKYIHEAYHTLRTINESPIPQLEKLTGMKGPWTGYQELANPTIWLDFNNLENDTKNLIGMVDLPSKINQSKNKQELSIASKILIEAMDKIDFDRESLRKQSYDF